MKRILFIMILLVTSDAAFCPAANRYELPSGKFLIQFHQEIMRSQIGISNANNPKQVKEYLDSARVRYYNPFCASGIVWALKKASGILKTFNTYFGTRFITDLPYPASAMANAPYNYALKHGTETAYAPAMFDKLIWRHKNGINGHIESVDSVGTGGWVRTIAFNTDNRKVKFKKRNVFHILGRLQVRGLVGFKYEGL